MTEQRFISSVIESIQCPICYLAMVPPSRTPMVIPECGHTICESCIASIKECPFCHQKFTNPAKNIILLQIADSANQNHLIPADLNPPPPAINKLVSQIKHLCTFAATDETPGIQKCYQCRTCKITGDDGFCEVCANNCHKGHNVYLKESSTGFICECHHLFDCKCLPKDDELQCTFDLTYGTMLDQPMFQCIDCNIIGDYYICQNCAIKCHHGHKLQYFENVIGKYCHCFDQSMCKITKRKPVCSYILYGPNPILQPKYSCKTCGIKDDKCCCSVCAYHCHEGHDIEFNGFSNCFCSCNEDTSDGRKCNICDYKKSSYLTRCPNFSYDKKNTPIQQRMYYCYTCSIIDPSGICEACAINCHINHSIEYVGMKNFICDCNQNGNCRMNMFPALHNDRSQCDRKVLDKDDVSACYTCLTCDPTGKKQICESCALKKHASHKIHLVGYMKFECNPTKKRKSFKPVVTPV